MKKLLMLALALCLSMTVCASALAESKEMNKDVLEGSTEVSLTIDHEQNSFVVVIPAAVTIDPETKTGYLEVVLKSGWKLVSSNSLSVAMKGFANGVKESSSATDYSIFTLKDSDGSTVRYQISSARSSNTAYTKLHNYTYRNSNGSTSNNIYPNYDDSLISVGQSYSNTEDIKATLKLDVSSLPTKPGVYTDTITFGITLN